MPTEVPDAVDGPTAHRTPPGLDPGADERLRRLHWRSRTARWWISQVLVVQVLAAVCVGGGVLVVTGRLARTDAEALAEQVAREVDYRASTVSSALADVSTSCEVPAPASVVGYAVVRNGRIVCRRQVEADQVEGVRWTQGLTFPPSLDGTAAVGTAVDGSLVVALVPTAELVTAAGAGDHWVLTGPGDGGGWRSLVPNGADVGGGSITDVGDGRVVGVVGPVPWTLAALAALVTAVPALAALAVLRKVGIPLRRAVGGVEDPDACREVLELGDQLRRSRSLVSELTMTCERQGVELRRQMAVDLHDGPVQDLATALLMLDLVEGGEGLGEVRDCVRSGVEELRRLCSDLLPVPVAGGGLVRSLRAGALELVEGSGLELVVDVGGSGDDESLEAVLDEAMSEVLVRNCLEAVRNAVRHSGGSVVTVRLLEKDGGVVAEIADDGVGMDEADRVSAARSGHVGLSSMAELVGLVGGEVSFCGVGGTTVRIEVPVGGRG